MIKVGNPPGFLTLNKSQELMFVSISILGLEILCTYWVMLDVILFKHHHCLEVLLGEWAWALLLLFKALHVPALSFPFCHSDATFHTNFSFDDGCLDFHSRSCCFNRNSMTINYSCLHKGARTFGDRPHMDFPRYHLTCQMSQSHTKLHTSQQSYIMLFKNS